MLRWGYIKEVSIDREAVTYKYNSNLEPWISEYKCK